MLDRTAFHIRGIGATLMHNGRLADPMNEHTKALKALTGKRKKTDEDFEEIAWAEFNGGMYTDDEGRPAWPALNVEAMCWAGAKKSREGKIQRAGTWMEGTFARLIYDGPTTAEDLFANPRFRSTAGVVVAGKRIMRTRPIFPEWELKFAMCFDPQTCDARQIRTWLEAAGRMEGLSDWRPRYGRFEIVD